MIYGEVPQWRRSRQSPTSTTQDVVLAQLETEVHASSSWLVDEMVRSIEDEHYQDEITAQYAASQFYTNLTLSEQSQAGKILDPSEAPSWLYGRPAVGQDDGQLTSGERYRAVRPVDVMSRYVLSGVLGEAIAHESPQLMERAGMLAKTPLACAIALGGAALTRYGQAWSGLTSGRRWTHLFEETYADGKATELFVGGDLHGDFRTEKLVYESDYVADTVHRDIRHWYAPVLEHEQARAYHTTEAYITAGLLTHAVRDGRCEPDEMYKRVMQEFLAREEEGVVAKTAGAFGDYGTGDGAWAESRMRAGMKEESYSQLGSLVIFPHNDERLVLTSVSDGVEFTSLGSTMKIKTSEIPEYISYLACGAGGRTDTTAILKIVEVLRSL